MFERIRRLQSQRCVQNTLAVGREWDTQRSSWRKGLNMPEPVRIAQRGQFDTQRPRQVQVVVSVPHPVLDLVANYAEKAGSPDDRGFRTSRSRMGRYARCVLDPSSHRSPW